MLKDDWRTQLPLAPLHMRLQKKVDAIPTKTQKQGLSLLELQVRMKGRMVLHWGLGALFLSLLLFAFQIL